MTHQNVIRYLTNRGWTLNETTTKFQKYSAPENLGFSNEYILPIPYNNETVDYQRFLRNNINIICDIYELTEEELEVVIQENNSIFTIRINDEDTATGKIGFKRFEELINGIQDLLLDSASFVLSPSLQTKKRPEEATRYLNQCNFLQTEIGSFIAKVELPENQVIREADMYEEEIKASHVNDKLKSVLNYVKTQVFNSPNDEFNQTHIEEHLGNINLNILKDIEKIYDKTESRNIDFYFSDIEESVRIETEEVFNNSLYKLTNLIDVIDQTFEEENVESISGRILNLKSNNPEGSRNEITIGALYNDIAIKAKANLNSEDYQNAVDAHKYRRNIQITGLLKKMKTQYKFVEVHDFSVSE